MDARMCDLCGMVYGENTESQEIADKVGFCPSQIAFIKGRRSLSDEQYKGFELCPLCMKRVVDILFPDDSQK